jgi:DNA-binding NarL/FixJ family response regulator
MPISPKTIAFDLDPDSLSSLREALPDAAIDEVNGATATALMQDWNPGTVDLLVLAATRETAETLELCRFLVSCGVLGRAAPVVTDSQEALPKTLGLHRSRPNAARQPHAPLLVLVPAERKVLVPDLLKAGADSCLLLPANAKEMASMLVRAQVGNQPGRHTLDLERAQTEDRWRDDGGQG